MFACRRAAAPGAGPAARAASGKPRWAPGSMQASTEVRLSSFLCSANVGIRHSCCPPQAIFDDLMFDAPSWGDEAPHIRNEEVGMFLAAFC